MSPMSQPNYFLSLHSIRITMRDKSLNKEQSIFGMYFDQFHVKVCL